MSKRPFWIFGVVAVIGVLVIPYWAIKVRGDEGAAAKPVSSSDRTAQTLFKENCGACHTLAAGGTDGVVGPNLDVRFATGAESKSLVDSTCVTVLNTINNGLGGRMPAGILQGANATLVANFISRNVDYVNTTQEPQKSNEVGPSQVQCKVPTQTPTSPTGGGGTANAGGGAKAKPAAGGKTAAGGAKKTKPTGGGKKTAAQGGGGSTIKVSADPSGALAFQQSTLSATAGNVTIDFTNDSPVGHNVEIQDASGKVLGGTKTITGTSATAGVNLKPGKYTFFCSVPGHEQAGMKGTLTVK
jgi:plastocyanin/mono/diheme cytochrome c family protein